MALMDLDKLEGFRFWRKASARPESRDNRRIEKAIEAFMRGRGAKAKNDPEPTTLLGDHISLMRKHPKLFG